METPRVRATDAATPPDRTDPIVRLHSADPDPHFDSRELRQFLHELSNLVDGSMRSVSLAHRDLLVAGEAPAALFHADRHLGTAGTALEHIAGLIRSVSGQLQGLERLPRTHLLGDDPRPLAEAIDHAAGLLRLLATDRNITIDVELDDNIATVNTPVFPALLNGLRNAIEAINHGGEILVRASLDQDDRARRWILVEIADDGPGPPEGPEGSHVFDFGFSTKPGSSGIGLSIAKEIVDRLGGTVSLRTRWPDRTKRRGGILTLRHPITNTGTMGTEP